LVKLTSAGRRLQRGSPMLPLTAKASFTPTGGKTNAERKPFTLRR
jgi:hypothetical protein